MSEVPTELNLGTGAHLGAWGREEQGHVSLEFVLEGFRVAGTDGCNRVFGSWELLDDGSVELKQMASTMMFCQDVDLWFTGATTVKVVNGALEISNAEATVLGLLERRVEANKGTESK